MTKDATHSKATTIMSVYAPNHIVPTITQTCMWYKNRGKQSSGDL